MKWLNLDTFCKYYAHKIYRHLKKENSDHFINSDCLSKVYYFTAFFDNNTYKNNEKLKESKERHKTYLEALKSVNVNINIGSF